MKNFKLFCLPFAGGNKYSYRMFEKIATDVVQILPLEYPGHGSRVAEPLLTDINLIVEDLYKQIIKQGYSENYALYGHSMGGLLCCLLSRKIHQSQLPAPKGLFITGTSGPSSKSRGAKKLHLLKGIDFLEELEKLDGFPQEALHDKELFEYIEPVIRADFRATENYNYRYYPPLDIPITVITGSNEDIDIEDIRLWQNETTRKVHYEVFEGKHFFIFEKAADLLNVILENLNNINHE